MPERRYSRARVRGGFPKSSTSQIKSYIIKTRRIHKFQNFYYICNSIENYIGIIVIKS